MYKTRGEKNTDSEIHAAQSQNPFNPTVLHAFTKARNFLSVQSSDQTNPIIKQALSIRFKRPDFLPG